MLNRSVSEVLAMPAYEVALWIADQGRDDEEVRDDPEAIDQLFESRLNDG